MATDIGLEPSAEVHRVGIRWDADITEIAGTIARRNVHAPAQGNREMGEVAADAASLMVRLKGSPGRSGVLVAEGDVLVHEITDRLHAPPPGG